MKQLVHTNQPDCCVTCQIFYENWVKTGKAKAPEPQQIQRELEKLIDKQG